MTGQAKKNDPERSHFSKIPENQWREVSGWFLSVFVFVLISFPVPESGTGTDSA
jgi:hypothetical protein